MSRPFSNQSSDDPQSRVAADRSLNSPSLAAVERLRRWGALVAVGEALLPTDLEPAELAIVLTEAGRLRRERLVRYIACALAQDLYREREPLS